MNKMLVYFVAALNQVYDHLCFCDVAVALLGLFLFSCMIQRLTNKGPILWPVMGIIPSMFLHVNHIYDWATTAFIRAGGTFQFKGMWMGGSYGILTADPSNIEYMLKTRFRNFPKGKYYRERFYDLLGDGIFNADDELWKQQRRIAITEMHSSLFVKHTLQTMQHLVQKQLVKLLDMVAKSGDCIDLQEVLLRFTFDNICITALGVETECLAPDFPQVPFAKAFEDATQLTLFRFMVPPFVWKPMKLFGLGYEKRLKEAITITNDFAEKTVRDRRNELVKLGGRFNGRSDLLSRLMEMENSYLSDRFLRDFCISLILAGRDTSSVGLTWFFWLVQKHPKIERRILMEINEIISWREKKEVVFTMEELKKMVYLEAALSESLRLYPPVPIDMKEVIEDDIFPDGSVVKKGARVMYCIYSMARMEAIWGKDCLEFKPERWIKDGKFMSENQFKYAVFNAGPRLCLGKTFAYMQMKMVAATILQRYEVKVVKDHKVVPKVTTTLYMKNGLVVNLKPRLVNSTA
ncbi:hypothetical protein FNV43_RR25889 [Rhamnella rubrinervis]|uniref:Cytochrome P450 n=1 Tax=Rhamnella rubrinervis TaxID=2594499 RepID=A0A8K0DN06_9ROSA|nr:hypothetical protein FNV43_RR25889 [Rhamnella rubrinervis]